MATPTHNWRFKGSTLSCSSINLISCLKILLYRKKNLQPNCLFKLFVFPLGQSKSWLNRILIKKSVVQTQIRRTTSRKSCANHLEYGQEVSRNYQSTLLYVPANELILQSTNALGCLKLCYYWKNTSTICATCGSPCPNCRPVKKTAFTITSSQ